MEITDKRIDGGKAFDWGKVAADYAKYRDIYPQSFYDAIIRRDLCVAGQTVLDIGTGTGVIPRNMHRYGAKWVGTDISEKQIAQAIRLSVGKDIEYYTMAAEDLNFPDDTFDVITACQCFWYFRHEAVMPRLCRILKPNGRILILYMAWLPLEDAIAGASEKLVLQYSPHWSGAGETIHPIPIPPCYDEEFDRVYHDEYPLHIHFTRESWHGRMKACRGVGASLTPHELAHWEREHLALLERIAPDEFEVAHYAALVELKKKR